MGKYINRQIPTAMPSEKLVKDITGGCASPIFVCGSRGVTTQENKTPNYEVHGESRFAFGSKDEFSNKHLIVFIHGYNNTTRDCLLSSREFFGRLHESIARDGKDPNHCAFCLFTWPGDTGPVYFNDAQEYAHHSGSALFRLLDELNTHAKPTSISLVSHSLGAHVLLRALSIIGERYYRKQNSLRVDRALLLAPAVEDDVFERPSRGEEYHFPESAFGVESLHIGISRSDEVLGGPFRINEHDAALGFSGPQSMSQLASLSRRVEEVSGGAHKFQFEVHDFSPSSATIMNPKLHVRKHGEYWSNSHQTDYYVNLIRRG